MNLIPGCLILLIALLCSAVGNHCQLIYENVVQDEGQTNPTPEATVPPSIPPEVIGTTIVPSTSTANTPTTTTTTTTTTTSTPAKIIAASTKSKGVRVKGNLTMSCPKGCSCDEKSRKLTCIGDLSSKATNFPFAPNQLDGIVSLEMRNFALVNLDLNQLVAIKDLLESLTLFGCQIETFSAPQTASKKDKEPSFSKLKTLDLTDNNLRSIGKLASWKFPALETLYLSSNAINEFGPNDFNNTKSLLNLHLQDLQLISIHEQALLPLSQLRTLNMTSTKLENHLGDKLFVGNQKLETVDLTDNGLIEVPFALRGTGSITRLILNKNDMTSLRRSDFLNRTKLIELEIRACTKLSKIDDYTFSELSSLKRLIISDNPVLSSISKDAFKSSANHTLEIIDIRNNNITNLPNPLEFSSLSFKQLLLSGNPWNCDCSLRWFSEFSSQTRPLAHCKSPMKYVDIEISEFLATIDCDSVESMLFTVLTTGIIILLLVSIILVFIQKSDICRRLFWRDQYGTIYYTKASFPPESM